MSTESVCPNCGRLLPADAPQGLCPQCLAQAGFATGATPPAGQSTAPSSVELPTVAELAAQFPQLEILELLGKGGMGAVYKAKQKHLHRLVALKILPPGTGTDPAFAERFTREAQALAQLNHPGIVTLYESGHTPGGLYYFLMEFVDGVNLGQLLGAGRVSAREALAIVPQICDALQYAHDQGIVHRDIKPENILLDRRGRVKVADFGLAKLVGHSREPGTAGGTVSATLTEAGRVLGTPRYMAPEQVECPGEVDHRADIYALGLVFYQMLTGELPGQPIEPPSNKVQIDVRLDEVVLHALEKKPELRYQQVSEVKTGVETILGSTAEPSASNQRLSRMAAAGALWIGLFFVNWLQAYTPPGWAITHAVRASGLGPVVELLVFLPLMALGFSALIGGTALGIVALREIRQSRGKCYGVGLALFDVLFFPLIFLNGWAIWLGSQVLSQMRQTGAAGNGGATVSHWGMLALVLLGLALNALVIHFAWRMAKKFIATPPPPAPPPVTGSWAMVFRQASLRLALVSIANLALLETLNQVSLHWKESTGELWGMALMIATLAGLVWTSWPGFRLKQSATFLVGGTIIAGFFVLALTNFYAWYVRPNLGLYREADWVVQNAGWQKGHRIGIARHLWRRPLVNSSFVPASEAPLSLNPATTNRLFDLDSGKEVPDPNYNSVEIPEMASASGLDIMALVKDGRFTVLGFGLAVEPVSERDWESASPQEVADYFLLEWDRPKESVVLWPLVEYWYQERNLSRQNKPSPAYLGSLATYFFRTREGATGILQFEVPGDNDDGARIRYKLVKR